MQKVLRKVFKKIEFDEIKNYEDIFYTTNGENLLKFKIEEELKTEDISKLEFWAIEKPIFPKSKIKDDKFSKQPYRYYYCPNCKTELSRRNLAYKDIYFYNPCYCPKCGAEVNWEKNRNDAFEEV